MMSLLERIIARVFPRPAAVPIAVAVLVAAAGPASAACSAIRCVDQLERLYLSRSSESLFISTAGDESNLNCNLTSGVYITMPTDNPFFREYLAMLLTAKASNFDANIRINEGSEGCTVSYVVIEASRADESAAGLDEIVEVPE